MSVFEAGMLLMFGFAWPINIYKSIGSRTAKGKSLAFQWTVLIGYLSGIIHKLLYSRDLIMALYILNFCMVVFDTVLCYRNKKLDKKGRYMD